MIDTDKDAALINDLGGPTRVAELLGFDRGGPQRVQNWMSRGIPARIRLSRPDLFMPKPALIEAGKASCQDAAGSLA